MMDDRNPHWVYTQTIKMFAVPTSPPFEDETELELDWGRVRGIDNDVGQIPPFAGSLRKPSRSRPANRTEPAELFSVLVDQFALARRLVYLSTGGMADQARSPSSWHCRHLRRAGKFQIFRRLAHRALLRPGLGLGRPDRAQGLSRLHCGVTRLWPAQAQGRLLQGLSGYSSRR